MRVNYSLLNLFLQGDCTKCLKTNFSTAKARSDHIKRCRWCHKCDSFRTEEHVAICKYSPEEAKEDPNKGQCYICFKWMWKVNLPRHIRAHQAQLDEEKVNISFILVNFSILIVCSYVAAFLPDLYLMYHFRTVLFCQCKRALLLVYYYVLYFPALFKKQP